MDREIISIKKAKKDIGEFDYLYRKYFPMINNFVFHRVGNDAIKDEIVSNIFFKAMRKLNLFHIIDHRHCAFSSWLYRIAVSEINQFFRDQQRQSRIVQMVKDNDVPGESLEFNFEIVRQKMAQLSQEEQNLVALRYFEKLSYKQIAEIYKKKEGALKVKVHRILKKLRDIVEKENNHGEF